MGLLIIVPLLVSGYMVCLRHPFFYNRLHRFQGQLLYLQVARLGMICLTAATLLSALILVLSKQNIQLAGHPIATDYSRYLGSLLVQLDIANEKNSVLWIFLIQAGFTAMLLPALWAKLYIYARKKLLKLETDEQFNYLLSLGVLEGNPFRRLLRESIEHRVACLFSLNDRKVYVGFVMFIGVPTESEGMDHGFTLLPILSGYRDKDTLEITFTTHYANTHCPPSIMLIQENVVSATRFDFTTWNTLQSRKNRKARHSHVYQHRPTRPVKAPRACA